MCAAGCRHVVLVKMAGQKKKRDKEEVAQEEALLDKQRAKEKLPFDGADDIDDDSDADDGDGGGYDDVRDPTFHVVGTVEPVSNLRNPGL